MSSSRTIATSIPETAALDTVKAAAYLGIARATLKKWRATGGGPPYVRAGSKIVYLVVDLNDFLQAHRVSA